MQLSGAHFSSRLSRCVLFPKDNVYVGPGGLALDTTSGQARLKATASLITENGSQLLRQHHGAAAAGARVLPGRLLRPEVSVLPPGESMRRSRQLRSYFTRNAFITFPLVFLLNLVPQSTEYLPLKDWPANERCWVLLETLFYSTVLFCSYARAAFPANQPGSCRPQPGSASEQLEAWYHIRGHLCLTLL